MSVGASQFRATCVSGALTAMLAGLAGCASTADYAPDAFNVADSGATIDASSGRALERSINEMVSGLRGKEKRRVARAIFTVATLESCLDRGHYRYSETVKRPFYDPPGARDRAKCGKGFQGRKSVLNHTRSTLDAYMERGRPDAAVLRTSTLTYGGAHVGPSSTSGHDDATSWNLFHQFGGKTLGGLTRDQLLARYQSILQN